MHDWHWSIGPAKGFHSDPPNAALIGDENNQDITIVELTNPVHNPTTRTLKYDVVLENRTSTDIPNEFGQSTLVIGTDVVKSCLIVVSVGC
jgi:hypothetical protein